MTPLERAERSLDGLSIGDAFGQSFFRLAREEEDDFVSARRLPPAPWPYTDDTEMALAIVDVLARLGRVDQDVLASRFAHGYHFDRGYGPAMHRVLARIRAGEDWRRVAPDAFCGQGSFGNGAAMRVAPLGAYFADDLDAVVAEAGRSAEVTHTHPEGIAGAIAVAVATGWATRFRAEARRPTHAEFLNCVVERTPEGDVRDRLRLAAELDSVLSTQQPAALLGNGVQMSASDTVPYALWCAAQAIDDFEAALWLAVSVGGDRDTLAAITGGVVASFVESDSMPVEWRKRREPLPDRSVGQNRLGAS